MNSQNQKPVTPWPLIVVFILISAGTVAIGILIYQSQKKQLLKNRLQELSGIVDLKVRQVSQWRRERIGDGYFISGNTPLIRQFSKFIGGEKSGNNKSDLLDALKSLTENYDYRNVILTDTSQKVILFYPDQDTVVGDYIIPLLPGITDNGEVIMTDLHPKENISFIHIDLVVPLRKPEADNKDIFGILMLRIDPDEILWPQLESWPVPSRTSEILLLHYKGNGIEYLSNPRHLGNRELALTLPSEGDRLATMIRDGIPQTSGAIDYRGISVVGVMKKIPDSPWYLIAKVDRDEVLMTLDNKLRMILVLATLLILTTGLSLGFLWRSQRVRFYRSRYEAELERLALVSHFDYILKYANDIIMLIDRNLRIIEANDRAIEAYKYGRDELIGKEIKDFRSESSISRFTDDINIINEKGSATYETIHKRKDGTEFPVEVSARRVSIEGVEYYQSISRDISERKKSEEILIESEERFRKIFEESPFGIVQSGKDFGILNVNRAFCKMLGYTKDELTGITFRDFTYPDHINNDEVSLMMLVTREIPIYQTEKRYIRKDGSILWGSATISIIRNKKGEVQFFLAMVEDITERKKAEEDLIQAKEKAEESDRLKTAFLHNVSHEIRTPMNAILGFTALMNEPDLKESERKQYVEIIFQSGNQLLSIINDIVDLASIESGQVKVKITEININGALRRLSEQFSYREIPGTLTLNCHVPLPDDEVNILTDGTKFVQIISNLINNALKFTKEGRIDFGYTLSSDFLEFFVKDSGIGIPPEHHLRIFDRFYQVDNAASRQFTGTGLGLSICKAYVELLGGRIWLVSNQGEGSQFYFTLPIKR